MNKNTHTPGPWYLDPLKICANGNRRVMAEQCTPIAIVPDHLLGDARLIASAPDLLMALENLLKVVNVRIDDPRIAQFDAARAALTKAKGE